MSAIGRFSSMLVRVCAIALLLEIHVSAQVTNAVAQLKITHVDANPVSPASDSLNFDRATVNVFLDLYEKLSEKHLVRDNNLNGNVPPLSMNATGLDKEQTLRLIQDTLLLNNVAMIPVDDQTIKVVTIGFTKNPRAEGIRLYTNAADLPTDDQIVSYYIPFDHISAQEAAGIFTQVSPNHTYGGYVPAPSANGVTLTENVSVIRQLIELKKQIDVRRDVVPAPPQACPPRRGHPLIFLFLLAVVFSAGYLFARFRLRKRLKPVTP